jgi:hypothetical protein
MAGERAGELAVELVRRHRGVAAPTLRKLLEARGEPMGLLPFYRLMGGLEQAGRVEGGVGSSAERGNLGDRIYRVPEEED